YEERDWVANPTILSGDIGVTSDSSDNSYHVVYGTLLNSTAILSGFTITSGNADGDYPDNSGGGMFNDNNSSPELSGLIFSNNSAYFGGGMYNNDLSYPSLYSVTFSSNSAGDGNGGGMYNDTSGPDLFNSTFTANSAAKGGGIYNNWSDPWLSNVTFSTNSAQYGGGIYNYADGPRLTNVTLTANTAPFGGGMYNKFAGNFPVTNSIIWGNTSNQIFNNDDPPLITYSDIQGGFTGEGNINQNPLFGPLEDNGGFTMTHALLAGSPAIDTAKQIDCPITDQRGYSRNIDGNLDGLPGCDMGAYEANPIIHVDKGAPGANTGTSWEDAFTSLQDALAYPRIGDEIWVAKGTYLPTSTTDRTISFQMKNGVAIYGGFAATETAREQRDWISNLTTLSGDIGTPDEGSDNSVHVVYGTEISSTAILDGFTITAGNANSASLADRGAGMFNILNSNPTLSNLTFTNNSATYGGGMFSDNSSPTLTNVNFSENYARDSGGGMYNNHASPTLTGVTFTANSAIVNGGGVFNNNNSLAQLTNVTISNNSAEGDGGGIYNWDRSSATLTNVTITANSADGNGGGVYVKTCSPTLINTILWGNTSDQIYVESGTPVITYSDIQGGYTGEGNIDLDPLLGPLADNGG
ncbi:MAG: hypothetical protein IH629_07195, partial [Thermoleophilia bacterium]|nr:hypothetical protein [Thermoleophilia bacterium]